MQIETQENKKTQMNKKGTFIQECPVRKTTAIYNVILLYLQLF